MTSRRLDAKRVHSKWDNSIPPILTVDSGDLVAVELREASDGQITPTSSQDILTRLDFERIHPLTGPIEVEGAQPGDTLQVDILRFRHQGWGWTAILPKAYGFGLLAEEFEQPYLNIWRLGRRHATFKQRIRIPLDPFCGVMGVAPAEAGSFSTVPPRQNGGNMDIRHLTAGSTLLLPVLVPGARFSVGDGHVAQGDGEVCVTAIEAPLTVTLRLTLRKGLRIAEPRFITAGPLTRRYDGKGYYATTGYHADLKEAAKKAVRFMIEYLTAERGLTREEAYVLCSVAVDLKISEIVDLPNFLVSAYLPRSIFTR